MDATHIKISANKKKAVNEIGKVEAKHYHDELMTEIEADRAAYGKRPFKDNDDDEPKTILFRHSMSWLC